MEGGSRHTLVAQREELRPMGAEKKANLYSPLTSQEATLSRWWTRSHGDVGTDAAWPVPG